MWGEGPRGSVAVRSKECCRTPHGARLSIPQTLPALWCVGQARSSQSQPSQSRASSVLPETSLSPVLPPADPHHGFCSVGLVLATALWLRQPPGFQHCAGAVQHSVLRAYDFRQGHNRVCFLAPQPMVQPSQRRHPHLPQTCELPEKAPTPFPEPSASTSWLCLFLQSSLGEIDWEQFSDQPSIWRDQGHPDVVTAFLMLEVLVGLSERAEMVSRVVLGQPGPGAECKAVAWFGLGVRIWGACPKNPSCRGEALAWLPWEVSRCSLVRKWKLSSS